MHEDHIAVGPGDTFTVTPSPDGYPAIRIENAAFVEDGRWLLFNFPGHDQRTRIDTLIRALTQLRDASQ